LFSQSSEPRPPVPLEPITAIIDAFETRRIVALGNVEFRGDEQFQAFVRNLVKDERFAKRVNDIVVEFGNSRYQALMDRYVRGEDIPNATLRRVWQDTTQIEWEWDLPIYEEFFRTIRTVNVALPRARELRVLLGDPPINWDSVKTRDDLHREMGDRDESAVTIIKREVLAKGRRALVIYGGQHLIRKNTIIGASDPAANGVVARLEKDPTIKVFTVLPETRRDLRSIEPGVVQWPVPSLVLLHGTRLGAAVWDANPRRRPVANEEQSDAILYLGQPDTMTMAKPARVLCDDPGYLAMRLSRLSLVGTPPGAKMTPADMLREACAQH